jgi:hypothetical protein
MIISQEHDPHKLLEHNAPDSGDRIVATDSMHDRLTRAEALEPITSRRMIMRCETAFEVHVRLLSRLAMYLCA